MVESNRSETAPASANLVMEEFCSCELTRSNSEAASSLTVESSGDILFPSANARPVILAFFQLLFPEMYVCLLSFYLPPLYYVDIWLSDEIWSGS